MPWTETDATQEKLKFIVAAQSGDYSHAPCVVVLRLAVKQATNGPKAYARHTR